MECLSHKSEIQNTFTSVRDFSFSEKRNLLSEDELNNQFLDAILDLKKSIKDKTVRIYKINDNIEK